MRRPLAGLVLPLVAGAALALPAYLLGAGGTAVSLAVYAGELLFALILIRRWTGSHSAGLTSFGGIALAAALAFALARAAVWLAVVPVQRVELGPLALAGVSYALFVALAEEVHFRGLVLALLGPRYGVPRALVLSAASFAVLHAVQGVMWLPLFLADGLVWGVLRVRAASIVPAFVAHALANLLTTTVLVAPSTVEDGVAAAYLVLAVAMDAVFIALLLWFPRALPQRSLA